MKGDSFMRKALWGWRERRRSVLSGVAEGEPVDPPELAAIRALRDDPPTVDDTTQEIPVVATEVVADPAPIARGICPECRKTVRLRKDGTISAHRPCDGGGREPLAVEDCEECAALEPPVYAETVHAFGHPDLSWPEAA